MPWRRDAVRGSTAGHLDVVAPSSQQLPKSRHEHTASPPGWQAFPSLAYAKMYAGKYSHRILKGIGHNVPQEAPEAFAGAVLDVDRH